jgi:hypothetical protein
MTAGIGVKGGNAHQTVNPAFTLKVTVGIIALDLYGSRFDAPFGFQAVHLFYRKALPFGPAEVHTVEHLRPVTGFRPARARMDSKEAAVPVNLAGHKLDNVLLFKADAQVFEARLNLRALGLVARLHSQFVEGFQVVDFFLEFLPGIVAAFEGFQFSQQLFRACGFIPEVLFRSFGFQCRYTAAE